MSVEVTSGGAAATTAYFNTTDTGVVDPFEVREGEAYYVECWIQAKSTNTGLGTVELVVQTNSSTVTVLDSVTITSGTKETWIQLAYTYQVYSGVTSVSFGVRLAASATTSGDIFYVDDMLVRETTFVQTTNNAAVNGFSGSLSTAGSSTPDDTAVVANNVKSSIQNLSTQVTALQNAGTGTSNSVTPISVDFTQAADASTLGASWSQWTSGSGTATLGITSGAALLKGTVTSNRFGFGRYTTASATNLHRVSFTVSSFSSVSYILDRSTNTYSYSNVPYLYLLGRVNGSNTQYVYAKMTNLRFGQRQGETSPKSRFEIGYVNGGSETKLSSITTGSGVSVGSTYTLVCGTSASAPRSFELFENGYKILTATDSGAGSALNNNFTGIGAFAATSTQPPGTVSAFSAVDLTVPTYRGSGFRRTRNSTTAVSGSIGQNKFPQGFFDTPAIITSDYTYTDTSGNPSQLTVSATGWYAVALTVEFDKNPGATQVYPLLYRNGTVVDRGTPAFGSNSAYVSSMSGSFIVYCNENDTLQTGYELQNFGVSGLFTGSSANTTTWSVTFIGNKAPS